MFVAESREIHALSVAAGAVTVGTLSGFIGTQTVTATGSAAAYSSANVGSYPATVVTYTLSNGLNGGLAANYSLANGTATGTVTAKALAERYRLLSNRYNFHGPQQAGRNQWRIFIEVVPGSKAIPVL